MEGDGRGFEFAREDSRKKMLTGVLLDVVEAAGPADRSVNFVLAVRFAGEVPDVAASSSSTDSMGTSRIAPLREVAVRMPVSLGWPPLVG